MGRERGDSFLFLFLIKNISAMKISTADLPDYNEDWETMALLCPS